MKAYISTRKNRYIQLFVSNIGFMYVVPMKSKTQIVDAVKRFAKEIGVSMLLILYPEGTHRRDKLEKLPTKWIYH